MKRLTLLLLLTTSIGSATIISDVRDAIAQNDFPKAGELIEITGAHALEASDRAMTPIVHFQRMVRSGLINSQGQLTKLFGGDADLEPEAQRQVAMDAADSNGERFARWFGLEPYSKPRRKGDLLREP